MRYPVLAMSACVAACGGVWNPFVGDTRTPADHARELMPKCSSETGEGEGVGPSAIEEVDPLITTVASGNDHAIHLRGAEMHMKPMSALSAEGLQRRLECHEALVMVGRATALQDDPYVLEGAWLGIKVRSDGDAFIVAVQTDVLDQAKVVLERARRFGARASRIGIDPGAGPVGAAGSSP